MSNQPDVSDTITESRDQSPFTTDRIALIVSWLAATGALIVMLVLDVRHTEQYSALRYILLTAYVMALLWYLGRSGSATDQLPEISPLLPSRWKSGALIPAVGVVLLLALNLFADLGMPVLLLLLIIATVWILAAWYRQISLRVVVLGCSAALIAFLGGLPFWYNNFVGAPVFILLLALTPPMFVAGSLLIKRTQLGEIQLVTGGYGKALQSFLYGCLLFIPLGLANAASGSPALDITWVNRFWMPVTLPWFSGITEEAWDTVERWNTS